MEAWDEFKVSAGKTIRDSFVQTKLFPISPPEFSTNAQACISSVQVSSGTKSEGINSIVHRTVGTIKVQEIRTEDHMVVLQAKEIQQ